MNKAVFIDKDGTLIPDIPYNTNPSLITLQENAVTGLRELQEKGYLLIIISNQAGVARGIFEEDALEGVKQKVTSLLADEQIHLDAFYYCPHHPEGKVEAFAVDCDCRKPKPGMLLKAAEDFDIDLSASWMIGDILNDVEAGRRAGCRAVLINNGNETEWEVNDNRVPHYLVENINEAAALILEK